MMLKSNFLKIMKVSQKCKKNIILVVSELVWDLKFVNLVMHYIFVAHGILNISLNERYGGMKLK